MQPRLGARRDEQLVARDKVIALKETTMSDDPRPDELPPQPDQPEPSQPGQPTEAPTEAPPAMPDIDIPSPATPSIDPSSTPISPIG